MALLDFFKKKSSGSLAKDRLKLVLISDRANCNPEIMEAIKKAGYVPGKDLYLALDVASSEFYNPHTKQYILKSENKTFLAKKVGYSQIILIFAPRLGITQSVWSDG